MKILILCDVLFPQTTGGAGRVARELGIAFRELGSDVRFLTRSTNHTPVMDEIRTEYFPSTRGALAGGYRKAFRQTFDAFQPQVVFSHQPLGTFLSLPRDFSVPLVHVFHSSWPAEIAVKHSSVPHLVRRALLPLFSRIERSVLNRAQAVVALSQYSRSRVESLYQIPCHVIPGGVASGKFIPGTEGGSGPLVHLITLRNLVPRMGLGELVRSMTLLPNHFRLTIGGSGPLHTELESMVQDLDLTDRVRLAGHIHDEMLSEFYSGGDWFILPTSSLEGFGLVILESLSCGTPVLGTRIGAIPELLEQFDPQWVIEEASPESIAQSILSASSRTTVTRRLLHTQVAKQFDWTTIARHYLELFGSLLR